MAFSVQMGGLDSGPVSPVRLAAYVMALVLATGALITFILVLPATAMLLGTLALIALFWALPTAAILFYTDLLQPAPDN